jgi:microcystin-dependent protein
VSYEPFIGEISMVGFNFAPHGWAMCDGQLLPIAQNQALFSLLGTTYGGDGITTFALPDLRGRFPLHPNLSGRGSNRFQGEVGGQEVVTLLASQMPPHTHPLQGADEQLSDRPKGGAPARGGSYGTPASSLAMTPSGISGDGQAHENMPPYLGIYFVIALVGIYPSRN